MAMPVPPARLQRAWYHYKKFYQYDKKSSELTNRSYQLLEMLADMHEQKHNEMLKLLDKDEHFINWVYVKLDKLLDKETIKKKAVIGAESIEARKRHIYYRNAKRKKHH